MPMTIIVPYYAYPVWRDQNMINSPNGVHSFLNGTKDNFSWIDDLILTFETPSAEEIARAICATSAQYNASGRHLLQRNMARSNYTIKILE